MLKSKAISEAFGGRRPGGCGCEEAGCGAETEEGGPYQTHTAAHFPVPCVPAGRKCPSLSVRNTVKKKEVQISGGLNMLFGIEPEGCNSLGKTEEWVRVEFAVDSGATETVMSETMLANVDTKEGAASQRGVLYEVANGVRIPNEGEKRFVAYTNESTEGKDVVAQI